MAVTFTATTVANPIGAQGNYPLTQDAAHEGMIADQQAYVSRSYINQSGAALPFGALLRIDNTPTTNVALAVEIAAGATNIVGLAVSSMTMEGVGGSQSYIPNPTPIFSDGRLGYPDKETVNVLSKGPVWVHVTEAVALGDDVRFWNATNTTGGSAVAGSFLGRFAKTAVANKTTRITGARWLSETSAAGLVLLELDIPASTFTADVP
jgi:hypothetical protein